MPVPPWPHPDPLDALTAAPAFHSLLLENNHVRVLDTRIPPGHTAPIHTHRWPSVLHILSWSDFIRRDSGGVITADTRGQPPPATTLWLPPLAPHTLENVGARDLHAISVELKNSKAEPRAAD